MDFSAINRLREMEIELYNLQEENRKYDTENKSLKGQLKHRNEEIKNLRRIINIFVIFLRRYHINNEVNVYKNFIYFRTGGIA